MMKKILLALGIVVMAIMTSAQDYISTEMIKKDTDVFMTVDSFEVTASYFWASLNFNRKDLLNYSFLISEEEEKMWSHLLGMDMAQFTTIWGRQEFEDSAQSDSSYKGVSSYWTGVSPNTNYKLYFAGRDTANKRNHSLGSIDFTTPNIGDSGRSQIKLELSHLSDTMIIVSAYPNENTAKYYTCIVSASIVDSLGMDSLRTLSAIDILSPSTHQLTNGGAVPCCRERIIMLLPTAKTRMVFAEIILFSPLRRKGRKLYRRIPLFYM